MNLRRVLLLAFGGLILAATAVVGGGYLISEWMIRHKVTAPLADMPVRQGPEAIARGRRLAQLNGCGDCHGQDLTGKIIVDDPKVARIWSSNLTRLSDAYSAPRLERARHMTGVLVATFLLFVSLNGVSPLLTIYTTGRYGWSSSSNGLMLACLGLGDVLAQGWLVHQVVLRLGMRGTAFFGIGLRVIGTAILGLAPTGEFVWLAVPLLAIGGVGTPAMLAFASTGVGPQEQARLNGVVRCVSGVAGVIGPALLTGLFTTGIRAGGVFAGAPMFAAVIVTGTGLTILAFARYQGAPKSAEGT